MTSAGLQDTAEFGRVYQQVTGQTDAPDTVRLLHDGWTTDSLHRLRRLAEYAYTTHTPLSSVVWAQTEAHHIALITRTLAEFVAKATDGLRTWDDWDHNLGEPHQVVLEWAAVAASIRNPADVSRLIKAPSVVGTCLHAAGPHALLAYAAGIDRKSMTALAAGGPIAPAVLPVLATLNGLTGLGGPPSAPVDPAEVEAARRLHEIAAKMLNREPSSTEKAVWATQGWREVHLQVVIGFLDQVVRPGRRPFLPQPVPRIDGPFAARITDIVRDTWIPLAFVAAREWVTRHGLTPDEALAWIRVFVADPSPDYPADANQPLSGEEIGTWHQDFGELAPVIFAAGLTLEEARTQQIAGTLPAETALRTMAVLRDWRC